jgi:hypothetical protein
MLVAKPAVVADMHTGIGTAAAARAAVPSLIQGQEAEALLALLGIPPRIPIRLLLLLLPV